MVKGFHSIAISGLYALHLDPWFPLQNTVLKTTAPKRRAVCLMVVVVFLMINVGPMR